METLGRMIAQHPFFAGLTANYTNLLVSCASNMRFSAGQYIFSEGQEANAFYLIRSGKATLEVFAPAGKPIAIETLEEGDILGWSWLLPPHKWKFHARAVEEIGALGFDANCLRTKCEENHDLGYELLKRFSQIINSRLEATRFQLLDVYGTEVSRAPTCRSGRAQRHMSA